MGWRWRGRRTRAVDAQRSASVQSERVCAQDSGRSCCSTCAGAAEAQSERSGGGGAAGGAGGGAGAGGGLHVAFHDLSVVPEEEAQESAVKSPLEGASCFCKTCKEDDRSTVNLKESRVPCGGEQGAEGSAKPVDVLLHDAPPTSYLLTAVTTPPPPGFYVPSPPAPGFNVNSLAHYDPAAPPPRFHTGGNIEDLLGDVDMGPSIISTEFVQQNSIFMCNTRKITHRREPCRCRKREDEPCSSGETRERGEAPKNYVTEKNIELTYDYPRTTAIPQRSPSPKASDGVQTTTEVASTVVFVERRYPVKPRSKFDFLFRSRSVPVGENEEPIYATVNKLPKRLQRRLELANLENEVSYRNGETAHEISAPTEPTEEAEPTPAPQQDDDTSRSDRERPPPVRRPDTPKAKKRRRFSFTFKKRADKKKGDKAKSSNGGPAAAVVESDNERLLEGEGSEPLAEAAASGEGARQARRCRHMRPRTIASSVSSGPRYKRDSYQEMTSHSEHERTNSITSSINSNSSFATHKSRKLSAPPPDTSIPWCGCWGTSCL